MYLIQRDGKLYGYGNLPSALRAMLRHDNITLIKTNGGKENGNQKTNKK
ncbi:MAG: hypothetical protein J6Y78_00625 [Paludibacteraceae bacterium]|nr:hypothetical protein [Paludibacteraceae bacterium]